MNLTLQLMCVHLSPTCVHLSPTCVHLSPICVHEHTSAESLSHVLSMLYSLQH